MKKLYILGFLMLSLLVGMSGKHVYDSPIYEVSTNNATMIYNPSGQPLYYVYLPLPPRGTWDLNKSFDGGATWTEYAHFIVKSSSKEFQVWVNESEGTVYYQFVPSQ